MAELNYQQFAGNWDPSKTSKFGWNNLPSLGNFSLQGSSPEDPRAALLKKYGAGYNKRFEAIQKALGADKEGLGAIVMGANLGISPETLLTQSEMKRIEAEEANKMARENLQLAEEASVRERGRDFTYGQLGNLFSSIPRAFSPISMERTQEVVANIANISSPRNITAIPQVSPAAFSYTPTKYFR